MKKDVFNRESANDLLKEYNKSLKQLKNIEMRINDRYENLIDKYCKIVLNSYNNDVIGMIKYINDVEKYNRLKDKFIQGELF